jgi:hypothetical protein
VVIAAPTLPPTVTPAEVAALPESPPAEKEAAVPAEPATETDAVPDAGPESAPYLVFGAILAALFGVLLVALWRRRAA